jgi:hypothetical protein
MGQTHKAPAEVEMASQNCNMCSKAAQKLREITNTYCKGN